MKYFEGIMIAILTGTYLDTEVTKLASQLSRETKEKLSLVYIIEIPRNLEVDREIPNLTVKAEETLTRMEALSKNMKIRPKSQIIQSRFIGSAVVSHAIEEGSQAIVMALPPKSKHSAFYQLSDSLEYVLEHAPCSVITCRPSLNRSLEQVGEPA